VQEGLKLKQDFVLADRTGFISSRVIRDAYRVKERREKEEGKTQYDVFVLDALGRDVEQISFQLLPCQTLQQAHSQQAGQPEPLRFKIAGIVTKYKGKHFLLLQRATPVYSYGNFAR
jgi:hypothetical protein